jgi:hypothetical protein
VQSRGVIDPISQVTDRLASSLQGTNNALFLLGIDLSE